MELILAIIKEAACYGAPAFPQEPNQSHQSSGKSGFETAFSRRFETPCPAQIKCGTVLAMRTRLNSGLSIPALK